MLRHVTTSTLTLSQMFAEVINQVPEHALISLNEETTKRMLRR